jgi:hypothetical protein
MQRQLPGKLSEFLTIGLRTKVAVLLSGQAYQSGRAERTKVAVDNSARRLAYPDGREAFATSAMRAFTGGAL